MTVYNNKEVKIKFGKSSLNEFISRRLPNDDEIKAFDQYLENEEKNEEIKESLNAIYQDDNGQQINVEKMEIKKQNRLLKWLNNLFLTIIIIGSLVYGCYYLYILYGQNTLSVGLIVEGDKEVMAGKEFFYIVSYHNNERIDMKNVEIKLTYPENFIFLDSQPAANSKNTIWHFETIKAHRSEMIKIKGKLIGEQNSSNIIIADANYTPANFSSEFKKSTSMETTINESGLEIIIQAASSVFVEEDNEIILKLKRKEISYLPNFLIDINCPDNWEIMKNENASTQIIKQIEKNIWKIDNLGTVGQEIKIKFKVKEKKDNNQNIILKFGQKLTTLSGDKFYIFYSKILNYEILQSGLNLDLTINDSSIDQGINFEQTLNYSLNYTNKSAAELKNIMIMVVLEGDILDWNSLKINNGQIKDNTINWTKAEIPDLAALAKNSGGVINFSIKIKKQDQVVEIVNQQIKSYAQFSTEGREIKSNETNRSKIIINKINSNLNLQEQIRYFNDDNIAVGFGPLPFKVGETTSLKVYWTINNSLHELNNLTVNVQLPSYVKWGNKNLAYVGSLDYDEQNNQVIWTIGRLPVSISQISAEFNIEITPIETDRNKILVLLPGTIVGATDSETNTVIKKTLGAQTTKLKDDNIANTDGIVE